MEKSMVGVIGFGNFGKFFTKRLTTAFNVCVWDRQNFRREAAEMGVGWAELEEIADMEIVVLAVPLGAMEALLGRLAQCINSEALVMDVCSVKQEPLRLMQKRLPKLELLGTHPLFGPQSAKDSWRDHRLVICRLAALSAKAELMLQFFREQGLQLFEMTAEQHDRQMASVQALTHFIARALVGCEVADSELATTAFRHLSKVVELLGSDSWELFKTIELGNPFAAEARRRFMQELESLERRLTED